MDRKPAELLGRSLPKHVLLLNCPTGIKNMADSAGLREQVLEPMGGLMVYRLALEAPETFTAVAAISANLPTAGDSDCVSSRTPVSIAILNGTADQINPFSGGSVNSFWTTTPGRVQSAEQSARYFAELAGNASQPRIERLPDREGHPTTWAERRTWSSGRANIELLAIHGGGHTISQSRVRQPRILGPTCEHVDAPEEVWRFFTQPDQGISLATRTTP